MSRYPSIDVGTDGPRSASVGCVSAASDSGAISIAAGNHLASLGASQLDLVFPGRAFILFSFTGRWPALIDQWSYFAPVISTVLSLISIEFLN